MSMSVIGGLATKLRRSALFRGAIVGLGVAMASRAPALSLSRSITPSAPSAAGNQSVVAHFDRNTRTLYIGAQPEDPSSLADQAGVTFSRAADLIGQPLRLIRPFSVPAPTFLNQTAMPSISPLAASSLTSSFGMRQHPLLGGWRLHAGVDLAARTGAPIVATSDGMVARAGWQGGYGLLVALNHSGGVQTRYGHMSGLNVNAGEQVHRGDVIGYVGSTGLSTGPHLHYEIRVNGRAVNPAPMLRVH